MRTLDSLVRRTSHRLLPSSQSGRLPRLLTYSLVAQGTVSRTMSATSVKSTSVAATALASRRSGDPSPERIWPNKAGSSSIAQYATKQAIRKRALSRGNTQEAPQSTATHMRPSIRERRSSLQDCVTEACSGSFPQKVTSGPPFGGGTHVAPDQYPAARDSQ